MDSSLTYLAGAIALAFILYYSFPIKKRWIALLLVSLGFYVLLSTYLLVFAVTTSIGVYFTARAIHKRSGLYETATAEEKKKLKSRNKAEVVVTIVFNLGILAFLKYYNFFGSSFCSLLELCGADVHFRILNLVMPLGISFYTLTAIGYLVDVHRAKYPPETNYFKVLLFLTFFATITEGPILRYDGSATLFEGHRADYKGICHGCQRILWGLFKKLVIADRVYMLVKTIYADPMSYSGAACLFFILGYTLQLYADFSGAMDIMIGASEIFGIKLPENFRQPFFAKSAQEFWQRWHITLGTWLKEYVFYSVALSPGMVKFGKKIKKKHKNHFTKLLPTGFALLAVWLCNGIWHGPQWNYIVYGLYYFVIIFTGMLLEPLFAKLYKKIKLDPKCLGMRIFRHIRTLLIIFIGETIFGAPTLSAGLHILGALFTPYQGSVLALGLDLKELIVLLIAIAVLFAVGLLKEKKVEIRASIDTLVLPLRWLIYVGGIAIVIMFGAYGSLYSSVPFMYGNF